MIIALQGVIGAYLLAGLLIVLSKQNLGWGTATIALASLLFVATATHSQEITEQAKIEALKLGYILNGQSMVRWGSIDLTDPDVVTGPIPVPVQTFRIIPTDRAPAAPALKKGDRK